MYVLPYIRNEFIVHLQIRKADITMP